MNTITIEEVLEKNPKEITVVDIRPEAEYQRGTFEGAVNIPMEELEERKRLLSDKRALIDEAFAQALDKLEAMPPQQARAFLMMEAAAVADGDETVILGSKNPGWFDDKFLADLNTLLQKQGKPGQLTLGNETRDGETGLLDSWRLDMEADIAAILFPDRPA